MADLHELSARALGTLLRSRALAPSEVAEHFLARIDALNPQIGAFITVTGERALERARDLERAGIAAESRDVPSLWGLPFADKDLDNRAGVRTTFGSAVFSEFIATDTDEVPAAIDAAGGVSLGKTNTPEFGQHGFTDNRVFGPTRNPWDPGRHSGGSSGGAAAAVAARMLPFAPGSDGGGSIRIPAAACGLVGLKPARGRVPGGSGIGGVGQLGVAGPIARSVGDAALLLTGMIGDGDPARFALRAPELARGALLDAVDRPEGRFRIGLSTHSPWSDSIEISPSADVLAVLDETVRLLLGLGHEVDDAPVPDTLGYSRAFATLWQAYPAAMTLPEGTEHLLEPNTAMLRERGAHVSAAAVIDAASHFALVERRTIAAFAPFDAVLTPALGRIPRALDAYHGVDADTSFRMQCEDSPYTSFVNVAGLPAIALPVGQDAQGHPIGVQLIGRPGDEVTLLKLGAQLEQVVGWAGRVPPLGR